MKHGSGLLGALVFAQATIAACRGGSSSNATGADAASSDASVEAAAGVTIGPDGGSVVAYGIELDVPPGALPAPVALSVALSTAPPPSGYTLVSSFYRFAPEGTTFAVPATVRFQVTATPPGASVYWSRASGGGYDPLTTTSAGTTATASITHFSHGFVGLVATGDAGTENDATSPDGAPEASIDGGPSSDADAGDAAATADDAAPDAPADADIDASDGATSDAPAPGSVIAQFNWTGVAFPPDASPAVVEVSLDLYEGDVYCNTNPLVGCTTPPGVQYNLEGQLQIDPAVSGTYDLVASPVTSGIGVGGAYLVSRDFKSGQSYMYSDGTVSGTGPSGSCAPTSVDADASTTLIVCP
jgi:hypothetical protein